MKLTAEQRDEIAVYISKSIKYRETFLEVLDHIISVFEDREERYDIIRLRWVIRVEFGGLEAIAEKEQKFMMRKKWYFIKGLGKEMIKTFRFPGIFLHAFVLIVCFTIYNSQLINLSYLKWIYFLIISSTCFSSAFLLERKNKSADIVGDKVSMKKDVFSWLVLSPIFFFQILLVTIFHQTDFFELKAQNTIILVLLFLSNAYLLAFCNLYRNNVKVIS
ncbi:MAG: hypothetical protein EOO44_17615 [Flavobacterium sp.]|nr:MAG: hypothetical protein EOO44_17615 [Flavobacterium sp.]